jgi:hypothetical protein
MSRITHFSTTRVWAAARICASNPRSAASSRSCLARPPTSHAATRMPVSPLIIASPVPPMSYATVGSRGGRSLEKGSLETLVDQREESARPPMRNAGVTSSTQPAGCLGNTQHQVDTLVEHLLDCSTAWMADQVLVFTDTEVYQSRAIPHICQCGHGVPQHGAAVGRGHVEFRTPHRPPGTTMTVSPIARGRWPAVAQSSVAARIRSPISITWCLQIGESP